MRFDDGIVFICKLTNVAMNGRKPMMKLFKVGKYWFSERMIGYGRQYQAMGVNQQVDMLIRINQTRTAQIGMFAMLGNGEQFRITNIQHLRDDDDGLRYTDLSLERLENYYEVDE